MTRKHRYYGQQVVSLRMSGQILKATDQVAKHLGLTRSDVTRPALKQLITTWRNDKRVVEALALDTALEEIHDPRQVDLFD